MRICLMNKFVDFYSFETLYLQTLVQLLYNKETLKMCNLVSQCGSNIKLIIDKIHQTRNNSTNKEMQFSYPNYYLKAIKYRLFIMHCIFCFLGGGRRCYSFR